MSVYSEMGYIMMAYDKRFKAFIKDALKGHDLTVAEALVLLSLYAEDGQTQDGLRSSVYYDKSVMTRTMQSLEGRKLISRSGNPDDKRSWLFHLTESGRALKPEIVQALRDWCDIAFCGLTEENADKLLEILKEIRKNIDEG